MIYALRIGEIPLETGHAIAYLSVDEAGMVAPVIAESDEAGLREIVAAARGREVICEEALGRAARRLGLRAQPLPPWTRVPRAELATVLNLGANALEPAAMVAVSPALFAAAQLVELQPWSWLLNRDAIDFEISIPGRPPRTFEGCVMGAGGQEYGVALYDAPGSLARLAKASQRGQLADVHAIDAYGFTIDDGPAWVTDAVAEAFGIGLAITPIRLRGGRVRAPSLDDLTLMASAAAAAAHLTPQHREHVATIEIGETKVVATATVREARVKARRPRVSVSEAVLTGPNAYCETLGISVPSLASVRDHRDATTYALLIVALLERGGPLTLEQAAVRFEAAGIDDADSALQALKRCRPARPPIYRDGEAYALDARDAEVDRCAFRLGLRPPKPSRPRAPPPAPRPSPSTRLTVAELDEGWRDANLASWSAQRIALAVLDAHDSPLAPEEVVAFVSARTKWHRLEPNATTFRRTGAAVAVGDDHTWTIVAGAPELVMARDAVRDAIDRARRAPLRSTTAEIEASRQAAEQRRAAHAAELSALHRVLVHAYPLKAPKAVVLVDLDTRELTTLVGPELADIGARMTAYDVIAGVEIRTMLRALGVDPVDRRLAELGPPQKSIRNHRSGATLKITTAMLISGSCGIPRPLGTDKQLRGYTDAQLRRRLEADAKSLFALHAYGRLHGGVRLRRGSIDEMFPAPWLHRDEPMFYNMIRQARALGIAIEAVVGAAPGWDQPWERVERLVVEQGANEYQLFLVDERGRVINERDVQLARLETAIH